MVSESTAPTVKRSLVALPQSGSDSSAPPFVMDLGNVSTEASSVVIDKNFPAPEKLLLPEQLLYQGITHTSAAMPLKVSLKLKDNKASGVRVVKRLNLPRFVQSQGSVGNSALNHLFEERNRLIRDNVNLSKKLLMFEKALRMRKALGSCS